MDNQNSAPSFRNFLTTFLLLTIVGWFGVIIIIFATLPTLGPRWLFFFFSVIALTGTFIPIVYYLHKRFPSNPPVEKSVILRESIFLGIFGAAIAWLRMGNVLNFNLALIIAGAFLVIELLLRLWENSRWKPR